MSLFRRALPVVVTFFLVTRIVLACIGFTTTQYARAHNFQYRGLVDNEIRALPSVVRSFAVWDGVFYGYIAKDGYPKIYNPCFISGYGFLPGYPLVIRLIHFITFTPILYAGLITSNLFLILAGFLLFGIVEWEYDEDTAKTAVKMLFLFPFSFVFSGILSESFFLFLSLLAVFLAQRNKYVLASFSGALSFAVRIVGGVIAIPLIGLFIRKHHTVKEWIIFILSLFTIPAVFGGIMIYFHSLTGNYFSYFAIQGCGWGHHATLILQPIVFAFKHKDFDLILSAIYLVIVTICLLLCVKKIKIEYIIYGLIMLWYNTLTGSLIGSFRYSVVVFPLYIALALLGQKPSRRTVLYVILSMLQGALMIAWALTITFTT